jgi:uncharacterized protein YndB with AHSA1/START domain
MKYVKWIALLFVAMIALVVTILLIMGHMPNSDQFEASTEINAPAAKVWAFLDDEQNMPKWISWLQEAKLEGPRGVGSKLTLVMRDENNGGQTMRLESRCTEYVPGSRLSERIDSREGQFEGTATYRVTDLGNGRTRLDVDNRYHFDQWFANLMSPLVLPAARSKMMSDMEHLKALVEKS